MAAPTADVAGAGAKLSSASMAANGFFAGGAGLNPSCASMAANGLPVPGAAEGGSGTAMRLRRSAPEVSSAGGEG